MGDNRDGVVLFCLGFDKGIGECEKGLSLIRSCTEYLCMPDRYDLAYGRAKNGLGIVIEYISLN